MTNGRIDVHAHYLGGTVARMMAAAPAPADGFRPGAWSVDLALEFMDRHDIATQVLSLPFDASGAMDGPAVARFARTVNQELAQLVKDHPDRFGAFATLPLNDADAAVAEIGHALDELGLDGVVLPSNTQGRYFGQPWFEPILTELGHRQVPTFVHPADCPNIGALAFDRPAAVVEFPFDTARNITNALYSGVFRRHPGLRLILAHAGGALPSLAWRISEMVDVLQGPHDDPDVTREHIAEVLRGLYYDVAIAPGPHSLLPLLACTGADHLVFGSDWPAAPEQAVTDADEEFARFGGLDAAQKAGVGRANAERLFPRLA